MKVLVTGGAGFIGSYTVEALLQKGYEVRILDDLEFQVHHGKMPEYLDWEKVEFIYGDIREIDTWEKALEGVEAVIHLSAMVGVGQSMYQPLRYLEVNTLGTANLYYLLLKNKELRKQIKKIVVASSKSIYGEGAYKCKDHGIIYPNPRSIDQLKKKDWEMHCPYCGEYTEPVGIKEDKFPQTLSIYALSKFDTERIALMYGYAFEIPTIALRYFNVYGPRQSLNNPYTGVCAIFLSRIKNNNPPIIFEDGKQSRDFIYVEDIARANLMALETEKFIVDAFNVGTGERISILEIAQMLIELCGKDLEPRITQEFRSGDNRHDFADITNIQKTLGWRPKWKLKEGMEKLVEWSQTQEAIDMFEEAEKERKIVLETKS